MFNPKIDLFHYYTKTFTYIRKKHVFHAKKKNYINAKTKQLELSLSYLSFFSLTACSTHLAFFSFAPVKLCNIAMIVVKLKSKLT